MPKLPLSFQIALAMVLGLCIGPFLGMQAAPLGELGKLVITLIKAAATPLLFLAIVNAVIKTQIEAKNGLRMLGFALLNTSIALSIGLALSNWLHPGKLLALHAASATPTEYAGKKIDILKTLASYIPQNVVQPFLENSVLPIVVLAVLLGLGLRRVRSEGGDIGAMEQVAATMLRVTEIALGWVITLIPIAVFGVVAKTVGEYGFAPVKGLAAYLLIGVFGLALHVVVTYQLWIAFGTRLTLRGFWREAREPAIYALGANSSLATLPVTLRALDRLGISRASSTLGACVGTNFNNDGIILYEGMAVLFVAQASGIDLSLAQQITVALTCAIAAMGVAGVPEAGFISLALVLNTVGLPIELLPLLLTVDWVIARARSVVNVLSDMLLSILIDRTRVPGTEDAVAQRADGQVLTS